MTQNRRHFLGGAAFLGGASTLGLAGCEDESTAAPQIFLHGVASGDPLKDAVIIWSRVTTDADEVTVRWEVATDEELSDVVAEGEATTDAAVDFTVKVDVTELSPGTTYYYRFSAEGDASPIGRTKTLPDGSPDVARLAIVSCASYAHGYFHAYEAIADTDDLDAVVHLGDYIYEYGDDEYGTIRKYDPPHEILTLEDYRRRYAYYRSDVALQRAHERHAWFVIWDDHEFADNAWPGGAENHESEDGSFPDRVTAAARAYREWMPIRTGEDPMKIYRSFAYGDLFELFLLDTRMWGRDEQAADKDDPAIADPDRTLLGNDQEMWLYDGLETSSARWKIVGQQVMMAVLPIDVLVNTDQWDGYTPARERFYGVISGTPVNDVIVLTGDIHTSWASDLFPDGATYDPVTGDGAIAVELVVPAVSSPGLPDQLFAPLGADLEKNEPNFKLVDATKRGYVILEVSAEQARASYHFFDQVEEPVATALPVRSVTIKSGENRLTLDT